VGDLVIQEDKLGGRGKHKSFPEENNSKEKALQKKIKQQDQEIKRLKSELKQLNEVLHNNTYYIKEKLDKVNIENLIENINILEKRDEVKAEKQKIKKDIKEGECPGCGNPVKRSQLPFGFLQICISGCGYREVIRKTEKVKNDREE